MSSQWDSVQEEYRIKNERWFDKSKWSEWMQYKKSASTYGTRINLDTPTCTYAHITPMQYNFQHVARQPASQPASQSDPLFARSDTTSSFRPEQLLYQQLDAD